MRSGDKVSKPASSKGSTLPSTASSSSAGFDATFALDGVFSGAAGGNGDNGAPGGLLSSRDVLFLQRTAGNRAVNQLLQRSSLPRPQAAIPLIQRKLAVGTANDPLEREADRAAKHISSIAAGHTPTLSKLTYDRGRPVIRRKVFFEVDELQQKNVTDLEIIKVNSGERPAFIKNRWQTLADGKAGENEEKQDYRHIVSFDLIKKALHQVLKNKTVDQAADWLGNPAHWIDQNYAALDMIPDEMLKTVQGSQAAAENWLRNANSFEDNLWLGPRKENRQKGLKAAQSKGKIRELFANGSSLGKWNHLTEVIALDKTIGSPVPFVDDSGLQFKNLADFKSRWRQMMLDMRLNDGGAVLRATPGSDLHVTIDGLTKSTTVTPALYVVSGEVFRVGRSFQIPATASILNQTAQDKIDSVNDPLNKARKKYIESQLDPSPTALDTSIKATSDSLPMYDTDGKKSTVVDVALSNSKYVAPKPAITNTTKTIQFARLDGGGAGGVGKGATGVNPQLEPQLEADIQRASAGGKPLHDSVRGSMEDAFGTDFSQVRVHTDPTSDRLNRSVNAKAFTAGHNIFFRQNYYKPQQNSGRELLAHELTHVVQQRRGANPDRSTLQRKVHFELREKQKMDFLPFGNVNDTSFLKWKIKHVEISGRPPVITSRQKEKRLAKQDYRHVVSFNLIAKALRKVLKGMTIGEASDWLRDRQNWIDQGQVDNDMLDARYMNSIQGVQMAAENWIKNANSFKNNLWAGPSKGNRSKGGEAAGAIKKISNQWIGPKLADITDGELQARASNGAQLLFENHDTKRFKELHVGALDDEDVFTATMGGILVIVHPDKRQTPLAGAIFVKGNALHKVGRQFQKPKPPKALKQVGDTTKGGELRAELKPVKSKKSVKGKKSTEAKSTDAKSTDSTDSSTLIKNPSLTKNPILTKSPTLVKSPTVIKDSGPSSSIPTAKSSSLVKSNSSNKSPSEPAFEDQNKRPYKTLKLASLKDEGVYKAPKGGKLYIDHGDSKRTALGVAIYVKKPAIYRVGRQFQRPKTFAEIQDAHLNAQLDPDDERGQNAVISSLTMRDKEKKKVPVTALALGKSPGKYMTPERIRQISQPVVSLTEVEVQNEIENTKQRILAYIDQRAHNRKYDQRVWQKLGLGHDDIERIFFESVIPNCKVKSDVAKLLKKTWDILNIASTAAIQMANLAFWVQKNYHRGNPELYLDDLRMQVYGLTMFVDFDSQMQNFCERVKKEITESYHQPAFDTPFSTKGPMSLGPSYASSQPKQQFPSSHHSSHSSQGPMSLGQQYDYPQSQQKQPFLSSQHSSHSSQGPISLGHQYDQSQSQQKQPFQFTHHSSHSSQGPKSMGQQYEYPQSQSKQPFQFTHHSSHSSPLSLGLHQPKNPSSSYHKPNEEIKSKTPNRNDQQMKKRTLDDTGFNQPDVEKKRHIEATSPILSSRSSPSNMTPTQNYSTSIMAQNNYIGRKLILHNDTFTDSVPATVIGQRNDEVMVQAVINGELRNIVYPIESYNLEWL